MQEDRDVMDLLTANYTFVNERLAKHYGIPNVYGSQFRRVTLTDDARRGLLGQGSILTVTSVSDAHLAGTSRQVDSREPAGHAAAAAAAQRTRAEGSGTGRQDSLGARADGGAPQESALRDVPRGDGPARIRARKLRRRRRMADERRGRAPIDASGQLADGTKIDGVVGLRQALLKHPEYFVGTLTEKMLTYALGRPLEYYDMPVVRGIVASAARSDYRFSSLISGIVKSEPFQMRRALEGDQPAVTTATLNRPVSKGKE